MNAQRDDAPIIGPDGTPWRPSAESPGWTPRRQQRTHEEVRSAIARARAAASALRVTEAAAKDRALLAVADALLDRGPEILAANGQDVSAAESAQIAQRLTLSTTALRRLADELRSWAAPANPVGEILHKIRRSDGVQRHQVRVPIGLVAVLYEDRVADGLRTLGPLLRTGSAVLLRGSRSVMLTSEALAAVAQDALAASGLPSESVQLISSKHRASMTGVITARGDVDLLIGFLGPGMRARVVPEATVPLLDIVDGRCHIYVDATADLELAEEAVLTSKAGAGGPGSVGTVLVHTDVAAEFLPRLSRRLADAGISGFGDSRCLVLVPEYFETAADDWRIDRSGSGLAVLVVESHRDALGHIARYGTGHTDAVITRDGAVAEAFTGLVDSATVVVNAPTTHDIDHDVAEPVLAYAGGRLGPRGPLGLTEFTTTQWIVLGDHGTQPGPMRQLGAPS